MRAAVAHEDRPELVMNTGIERVLGEFAARQFAEAFVTISHHLRSLQLLLGLIQLSLLLERLKQQPVTLIIVGQLDDRAATPAPLPRVVPPIDRTGRVSEGKDHDRGAV